MAGYFEIKSASGSQAWRSRRVGGLAAHLYAQDRYALESQRRVAKAQQAELFDDEIVPMEATMAIVVKQTKAVTYRDVTLTRDEGNRPETTLADLARLKPVIAGGVITAGNASHPYGMTGARLVGTPCWKAHGAGLGTSSSPCAWVAAWGPPRSSRSP